MSISCQFYCRFLIDSLCQRKGETLIMMMIIIERNQKRVESHQRNRGSPVNDR